MEWQDYQEELSQAAGQQKGLEHVFRKHVKPKKQHEIARLSDVIRTVANSGNGDNVSNLVDVGSGLGHLSRLLSFGHGFKARVNLGLDDGLNLGLGEIYKKKTAESGIPDVSILLNLLFPVIDLN